MHRCGGGPSLNRHDLLSSHYAVCGPDPPGWGPPHGNCYGLPLLTAGTTMPAKDIVFLFDVDNTLLDNDAVQEDLSAHLESEFGRPARERYWAIFETLRSELGYADYLGALQRYRLEDPDDPQLLRMSAFLIDYPFESRLYPGALSAISHCRRAGPTAILSDGDVVFQPRKVMRSGLWDAVEGRVMIYLHKEQMLEAVARHYPAKHYV